MPAARTLEQHVRGKTFRSRRHHELLTGPAVPWPALAALQREYGAAPLELERRAIGIQFERAVRDLAPSRQEAAAQAELQAILDMPPVLYDPAKGRAETARFHRAVRARDLLRDGLSRRAIARRIGVSAATVDRYLQELERSPIGRAHSLEPPAQPPPSS